MLKNALRGKVVFVGVGNPMRGDDGVGPYIACRIHSGINAETVPENFISKIKRMKRDSVVIFDALDFGGKPGEIKVIDANDSTGILLSTHALPLSKFSEMLKPAKVWLVGIQPLRNEFGQEMSKEVKESAFEIIKETSAWLQKNG